MPDTARSLPVLDVPSAGDQLDTIRHLRRLSGSGERPLLLRYAHLGPDHLAAFMVPLWRLPEETSDDAFPTECMEVTGKQLGDGTFRALVAVLVVAHILDQRGGSKIQGDTLQTGTVRDIVRELRHGQSERVSLEAAVLEAEEPPPEQEPSAAQNINTGVLIGGTAGSGSLEASLAGMDDKDQIILDVGLRTEAALGTPYAELRDRADSEDKAAEDKAGSNGKAEKAPPEEDDPWLQQLHQWQMVGDGFEPYEMKEDEANDAPSEDVVDWEWIARQDALPDWLREMCLWVSDAWDGPDTGRPFWSTEALKDLLTTIFTKRAEVRKLYSRRVSEPASEPADDSETDSRPVWDDRWMAWPPLSNETEDGANASLQQASPSSDAAPPEEQSPAIDLYAAAVEGTSEPEDRQGTSADEDQTAREAATRQAYLEHLRTAMMIWGHRTVGRTILQPWITTTWHIWPDEEPTSILIEPQGLLHVLPLETAPVAWPWEDEPDLATYAHSASEDEAEEANDARETSSQAFSQESPLGDDPADDDQPGGDALPEDRTSQSVTQRGASQRGDKRPLVQRVPVQKVPSVMLMPSVMDLEALDESTAGRQTESSADTGGNGRNPNPRSILVGPPRDVATKELERVNGIVPEKEHLGTHEMERERFRALVSAGHTRHVHILAHGEYNARSPLDSQIHGTDGALLTVRDLVDGTIDLSGVRLVYLSSCWSGHGEADYSDEVMGLVHGMLSAGAACVVGHLYPVDSSVAAAMAEEFYTHFVQNGTTVRTAYRATITKTVQMANAGDLRWHKRADWTGFTLYGDPSVRYTG